MLTSFTWVPKGAMRPTPLLSSDTVEEARRKMHQLFPAEEENEEKSHPHRVHAVKSVTHGAVTLTTGKGGLRRKGTGGPHDLDEEEDEKFFSGATNDTLRDIAGGGAGAILEQVDSDDEDEIEDRTFKETDLVFGVTVADDGRNATAGSSAARLELYTYDEVEDNLFIHHDMDLGAFPLTTAWLTDGATSLMAVGTMLPLIEIWALDVMDSVAPMLYLGGCEKIEDNYVCSKKRKLKPESHTDAVLSVAWNSVAQNILVSGSADHTIKIWDLNKAAPATHSSGGGGSGVCLGTYREDEKVQSVCFHQRDPNMLLSGGFDGVVRLRDCRHPQQSCHKMLTNGEVIEHVEFVPEISCMDSPMGNLGGGDTAAGPAMQVMASTSAGAWATFDLRQTHQPLWSFRPYQVVDHTAAGVVGGTHASTPAKRHSTPTSTDEVVFSCSLHVPGLAATAGKDGYITLWDCRGGSLPEMIVSRDYKTGGVLSIAFHPNSPHILGACGVKGEPLVYTMVDDLKGRW